MASADTLCKKMLNVKNTVVESHNLYDNTDGVTHLRIKARPNIWYQDECPFCGRRNLSRYDRQAKKNKVWRYLVHKFLVSCKFRSNGMPIPLTAA